MSSEGDKQFAEKCAAARELFEARAVAELGAADLLCPGSDSIAPRGDILGEVLLLKGLPGPAEAAGGSALSGPDGEAADKAIEALGFRADAAFRALSRPVSATESERFARRVRLMVEAVDPRVVIALDAEAAEDLACAFQLVGFEPGMPAVVGGRQFVAVSGFEASLGDPARKKRAWSEFRHASPPKPTL